MAGRAGTGELQFRARCARCSNCAFEPPERLDLGADIACRACGHRGKLVEFADVATLDAILEALKKRAVEALGGPASPNAAN